ncbi:MAG TPA: ATP-binding protein [Actinomycetota bacterium]|jgi:heavy metal sensor kinase|nr:ATP-binding protein [Actinomycetota bacterium]
MRLPIRTRLTLVSAALMAAVLAAAGAFLYLQLRLDLLEAVDAGLRSRAEALLGNLERSGDALGDGSGLAEPEEAFGQVLGPDGHVIESSSGLESRPLLTGAEVSGLAGPRFLQKEVPTAEEQVPVRFLAVPASDGRVLLVGASLEDQQEALARLGILLAVGGPLALILATGVGWAVAGAALRPVERMRAQAAAISALEPGRRLPPAGTGDEVARLGETLNAMLERLEQALQRERRFVDEASHELRTPLANLRTELDLALRRSRSPQELEDALRSAAEETERLARLAEDLLVLARADRGRVPVRREQIDLAPLLAGAIEAFATRAAEAGVSIEVRVSEGLRASLDPLRIRQAVGNLLDNALRHTPRGGRVTVEAARADGSLSLEVRDTGEGFPATFLPSAFEPFARPDGSRSRADGGTGLGLAIVRAVAQAHGGAAEARNRPGGGASVTVRIPE